MTAPVNTDLRNPAGVAYNENALEAQPSSPQRGRGAGGEGDRELVGNRFRCRIQLSSTALVVKSPLHVMPPHRRPLSRVGERGADLSTALQFMELKGPRFQSFAAAILLGCLWMLLFIPTAAAQAQAKKPGKPIDQPATQPQGGIDRRNHVQKVFAIKHAEVNAMGQAIRIFPVEVRENPNLRVIAVSGPPALMPTIEDTIRKLDVPPPTPQNVELTVYLLLGSDQEGSVASELDAVAKQLKATFGFKGFRTLDTLVVRSRDGRGASVKGIAQLGSGTAYSSPYHFRYSAARILPDEKGRSIRLDGLAFSASIVTGRHGAGVVTRSDDAGFGADVDVREGQKVIVGKTAVEGTNTALMLVITAKVLD